MRYTAKQTISVGGQIIFFMTLDRQQTIDVITVSDFENLVL